MIEEVGLLQPGVYMLEAQSGTFDLDPDCMVGAFDLALLLGAWGPCP